MDTALLLSGIVGLGIGAQWLAWYLKQPSILFLLLIGIIVGPVLGFFSPDEVLGDLLFPFISLGVAIILFEGSLTLEFDEIRQHGSVVQKLVSIGTVITIAVVALSTYFLFDVDPLIALLFGSLVCVTGPTVIIPLLRSVRPNKTISNILKWEGIIIDPIGAIAVVLVYEYIISGGKANGVLIFFEIVAIATAIGMFGAWMLAYLMKRHMIPEYLMNVVTLAVVMVFFSLSNHFEHESGLLAVTVMGVALANWKGFPKDHILEFNESLTVLLISVLFIVLAARVELDSLANVGLAGIALLVIVMFVARPMAVWASSFGSSLNTHEKLMITWIGPRGIVAAAISSLFAIKLQDSGLQGVELLVPLVFLIIIGTVLVQGLGAKVVASMLGVREVANNGVLIVGSNPVSIKVAKALKDQGIDVIIADDSYISIAKARMQGIKTYYGNPMSEHAYSNLELLGIGSLFALSMNREVNNLAELYYRHEFGNRNVFRLKLNSDETSERENKKIVFHSQWLFGKEVTHAQLAEMIEYKAKIKATNITENYNYHQYREDNKHFVPLYTIDKEGVLHAITSHTKTIPTDRKLVSLVLTEEIPAPNMIADLSDIEEVSTKVDIFDKKLNVGGKGTIDSNNINSKPNTVDDKKLSEASQSEDVKANKKTIGDKLISDKASELDASVVDTSKQHTNGNGQAPKDSEGRLDAKRLPDSSS